MHVSQNKLCKRTISCNVATRSSVAVKADERNNCVNFLVSVDSWTTKCIVLAVAPTRGYRKEIPSTRYLTFVTRFR